MVSVVLVVVCALIVGGLVGTVASRLHLIAGPVVVATGMAILLGITVLAARSAVPDARIAFGLFTAVVWVPVWVGEMVTITWAPRSRSH